MGRKKASRPFKDFYAEWAETLRSTLLPLLRRSLSASATPDPSPAGVPVAHLGGAMLSSTDLLPAHVHTVHGHFQAYLAALDLAAHHDPAQLLSPSWRSPLAVPTLWLGDLHPALLSTLLRSFLSDPPALAFQTPSKELTAKMDEIERGLRLMVPAIMKRFRDTQAGFLEVFAAEWVVSRGRRGDVASPKGPPSDAVRAQIEELAGVFLDANRLRRSVLAEIVGALDVYQAALYLEKLAQFVVGFCDPDLVHEFEQCKTPLSPASA